MTIRDFRTRRFLGMSAALLITALGVVVGAQAPPQDPEADRPSGTADQSPVFRSGVTLVTTDVIVRDQEGVFLADLTERDFRVYEDDRDQEVASLVLVHGGRVFNQLLPPPPVQEGIILPTTRAPNDTAGRIFIILLDDLHIDAGLTPKARRVIEQLLDNLIHEGDLFGIISTGPSSISIDMTYDRSLITQAASRMTGDGMDPNEIIRFVTPGRASELRWRAHVAFKTMRSIIASLEQIHNRRKVVVYISSGYDFNPFENQRIFGMSVNEAAPILSNSSIGSRGGLYNGVADPSQDPFARVDQEGSVFSDADLAMEISELTKVANRANATFYTVDPRGLVAGPDIDYRGPLHAFNDFLYTTQGSLRTLAQLTGGTAVVNRNDFVGAFQEIDAETSDYYVLGFYSSNPDPTYRTRRLRVEVAGRGDVEVQHRTHYTYARPDENTQPPPP